MWQDLSIQQKSELIRNYIRNGVTNLSEMQRLYDQSVQEDDSQDVFWNGEPKWKPKILGGEGRPQPKGLRLDDMLAVSANGLGDQYKAVMDNNELNDLLKEQSYRTYSRGGNLYASGGPEKNNLWSNDNYKMTLYPNENGIYKVPYYEDIPLFNEHDYDEKVPDSVLGDYYKGKGYTYGDMYALWNQQTRDALNSQGYDTGKLSLNEQRRALGLKDIGDTGELRNFAYPIMGAFALPVADIGGLNLIADAATYPIRHPISTITGYLGGKAVDKASEITTGKDWASNISDVTSLPTWVTDFTNPGYVVGGKYGIGLGKRMMETAARSSYNANPVNEILGNFEGGHIDNKRKAAIIKYWLTGKATGPKYYSRSFDSKGGDTGYGGFNEYTGEENDMLDAYFYGKTIDPVYGLKKMPNNDLGVFEYSYVPENYASKRDVIPVYEQSVNPFYTELAKAPKSFSTEGIKIPVSEGFLNRNLLGSGVDVAGHRKLSGILDDGSTASSFQDIWKFNRDYKDKYLKNEKFDKSWKKLLADLGLYYMDKTGTPVITRTPWVKVKDPLSNDFDMVFDVSKTHANGGSLGDGNHNWTNNLSWNKNEFHFNPLTGYYEVPEVDIIADSPSTKAFEQYVKNNPLKKYPKTIEGGIEYEKDKEQVRQAYLKKVAEEAANNAYKPTGNELLDNAVYSRQLSEQDIPLSGTDPIGQLALETVALDLPFNAIGKGAKWAAKKGNQLIKNEIVKRAFSKSAKDFEKSKDIIVNGNFFKDPSKAYRIISSPEKSTIEEFGYNVTSRDALENPELNTYANKLRTLVIDKKIKPGTSNNEGYFAINKEKPSITSLRKKNSSSHGNMSQASLGKIWDGGLNTTREFPTYILETNIPNVVHYGVNRNNFKLIPRSKISVGDRIGFKTGEIRGENAKVYKKIGENKYLLDEGPLYDPNHHRFSSPKKIGSQLAKDKVFMNEAKDWFDKNWLDDVLKRRKLKEKKISNGPLFEDTERLIDNIPKVQKQRALAKGKYWDSEHTFALNSDYDKKRFLEYISPGSTYKLNSNQINTLFESAKWDDVKGVALENGILFPQHVSGQLRTYSDVLRMAKDGRVHAVGGPKVEKPYAIVDKKAFLKRKKDAGEYDLPLIVEHERQHMNIIPKESVPEGVIQPLNPELNNISERFSEGLFDYATRHNNTELGARIAQILNINGINDARKISGSWLKDAWERYLKNGWLDNNMKQFYNMITDWDAVAEWANNPENVLSLAPLGLLGLSKENNKRAYGGKINSNISYNPLTGFYDI